HAWNRVKIGSKWYYVDCTWDDPISTEDALLFSQNCGHSTFLHSDAQHRATSHTGSDWVNDYGEPVYGSSGSTGYDNAWFKSCTSPIAQIGNLAAFIGNESEILKVHDYSTGSDRNLATLEDNRWPVYGGGGSYWTKKYWGVATDGTNFYVSGPKTIYTVTPSGTKKTLYTLTSAEQKNGYIYGIYVDGDNIAYEIYRSSNANTYQTTGTVKIGGGGGGDDPQPVVVTKITVTPAKTSIVQGTTTTLTVKIEPEGSAKVSDLIFSSSDQGIATVNSSLVVTGVYPGTATITAATQDGSVKGTCNITVTEIALKSISIYAAQDVLLPDGTTTLTAKYEPANATYQGVTWSSLNPDIATVDNLGKVKAVKPGQATIKAVSVRYSDISATKIIQVMKPVEKVSIQPYTQKIEPGNVIALKAVIEPSDAYDQTLVWTSSDTNIATVTSTGSVKAVKEGTVTITATSKADNTKKGSITLTISQKSIGAVVLNENDIELFTGNSMQLIARIEPEDSGTAVIEWQSKNNAVATVDQNGIVTGVKAGETIISAGVRNGPSAECIVTVRSNELTAEILYPEEDKFFYYTGEAIKPSVAVIDSGRRLVEKTDYTLSYSNNKLVGTGTVSIKMKGSYSGTKTLHFEIRKVNLDESNKGILVDLPDLKFNNGKTLKPKITVYWNGKKLSDKNDYSVTYSLSTVAAIGEYTATIAGKGNYSGSRTIPFSVEASPAKATTTALSKTTAVFTKQVTYDGSLKTLEDAGFVLKNGTTVLRENVDYFIVTSTYAANVNAGSASVTVQGIGAYSGVKKLKYTILADTKSVTKDKCKVVAPSYVGGTAQVPYAKGGAVPEVVIEGLRAGSDYKVSYKNNKAVGKASATVTFQGNYKGTLTYEIPFQIVKQNIANVTVYAKDITASTKNGNFAIKPTVTDLDGKALGSGKDYDKNFVYTLCDANGNKIRELNPKTEYVSENAYVRITIKAIGTNYSGTAYAMFHVIAAGHDISKASVTIKQPQHYTGMPVCLKESDITVTLNGKKLVLGKDYKILSYTNNIKTGTAKVTLQGIGEYGGVVIPSFKIDGRQI
ncbi:MAG: Ig-like domain-containing protein, partial [Solobacterium sp.]|nr:Ig-like domain-containing protein [Solobacterium sp.]